MVHLLTVRSDGASRAVGVDPDAAAIAYVLLDGDTVVEENAQVIEPVTPNVAEYRAARWGVERAAFHGATKVRLVTDSQVIACQLNGTYAVRSETLRVEYVHLMTLLATFPGGYEVAWQARGANCRADRLAAEVLGQRVQIYLPPSEAEANTALAEVVRGLAALLRAVGARAPDLLHAQGVDLVVLERQIRQALHVARKKKRSA